MDETTTSFGYWVRRQRRALDLTQRALAACVECSVATIKKIEADERRPSLQVAERIATCLHVSGDQRDHFLQVAQRERVVDSLPLASIPAPIPGGRTIPPPVRPATRFIGRADELHAIEERLLREGCRLLSVVGIGGVGKTRLALEAATLLAHSYVDGVCFVPLADIDTSAGVVAAVLRRLGLASFGSVDALTQLTHALHRRHLLLVLDNLEHLLRDPEMCDVFRTLLTAAPQVAVLVTSRERLNLQEEWVLPLDGLSPDEPAIALFADRARQLGHDVSLAAPAVATICRLVEGLPLAVELAAGWTQFMTPEQIVTHLQAGPDLLSTRLRDVPDRHRSLAALFDQSWALLTTAEQAIFMRLAVFHGGFDHAAAQAVAGADLPALLGLVDKSLVRADGRGWFDLHALARHYAVRRLAMADATADTLCSHANYYFALVRQATPEMQEARRSLVHERIDAEYANIRAALQWAIEVKEWTMLWSVVLPLFDFWISRGYWSDGIFLLQNVVQHAPPDDSSSYAQALIGLGTLLALTGYVAEALPYADDGYRRALMTGEPNTIAMAEQHMGMLVAEAPARERHFQAALVACRRANNSLLLVRTLLLYGDFLREQGTLEQARRMYTEMLSHARAMNDDTLTIYPLGNLGRLALLDGDIERAVMLFSESVAMARTQGNPTALTDWLLRLGIAQYYRQESEAAYVTLTECVNIAEALNHWRCLPNARVWLAAATLARGNTTAANRMLHMSVAGYGNRLHSHASAHPSVAELVEALVVAAHIHTIQHHNEEAAIALGCAQALRTQSYPPSDPFIIAMADNVHRRLVQAMEPATLDHAINRGLATSALVYFTVQLSETNSITYHLHTFE